MFVLPSFKFQIACVQMPGNIFAAAPVVADLFPNKCLSSKVNVVVKRSAIATLVCVMA